MGEKLSMNNLREEGNWKPFLSGGVFGIIAMVLVFSGAQGISNHYRKKRIVKAVAMIKEARAMEGGSPFGVEKGMLKVNLLGLWREELQLEARLGWRRVLLLVIKYYSKIIIENVGEILYY
jgi:hypothetical protein